MILTIDLFDFDIKYLYYHKKKSNNINNTSFIRLCYSNSNINLNGIYLKFKLNICKLNNHLHNHYDNSNVITTICNIEKNILNSVYIDKYNKYNAISYKIKNICLLTNNNCLLDSNNIKFCKKNITNIQYFILKISGIWLNGDKYGLIYKIYKI